VIMIFSGAALFARVPDWVPDSKKEDFQRYVQACDRLEEHAESYREILEAETVMQSCQIKQKILTIYAKRAGIDIVIQQEIPDIVSCSVKDGKAVIITREQKKSSIVMVAATSSAVTLAATIVIYIIFAM